MKLYDFANFVKHLVPYEYAGISLVVIEAFKWLLYVEGDFIVEWDFIVWPCLISYTSD